MWNKCLQLWFHISDEVSVPKNHCLSPEVYNDPWEPQPTSSDLEIRITEVRCFFYLVISTVSRRKVLTRCPRFYKNR